MIDDFIKQVQALTSPCRYQCNHEGWKVESPTETLVLTSTINFVDYATCKAESFYLLNALFDSKLSLQEKELLRQTPLPVVYNFSKEQIFLNSNLEEPNIIVNPYHRHYYNLEDLKNFYFHGRIKVGTEQRFIRNLLSDKTCHLFKLDILSEFSELKKITQKEELTHYLVSPSYPIRKWACFIYEILDKDYFSPFNIDSKKLEEEGLYFLENIVNVQKLFLQASDGREIVDLHQQTWTLSCKKNKVSNLNYYKKIIQENDQRLKEKLSSILINFNSNYDNDFELFYDAWQEQPFFSWIFETETEILF